MTVKHWRVILASAVLAAVAFAATASAAWNGLVFPRNGSYYATPGTYYDTPEWLYVQHTGGPAITNYRLQLRRASNGQVLWTTPTAISLTIGAYGGWQWRTTPGPDYPGGVRIWAVAGPADGQITGAYFCGKQIPGGGCPPF